MRLFKNHATTLEGVIRNQKHASYNNLQLENGELILIQQTVNSLRFQSQKTIRWIMEYVETYEDVNNESDEIWGQHWNYIIRGENLRPVEGFNISDIQVTNKNYGPAIKPAEIEAEDEIEILKWIGEIKSIENENEELAGEFQAEGNKSIDEIISKFDERYAGNPNYKHSVTKKISRPTALRNAIIERDGTICKICKNDGFLKKNGERYCELHHMIELNHMAPNTLQSWNILILCPTCHKQIHYGNVSSNFLNPGWEITIDGNLFNTL
jgi:5-methylcytosine-specific restriction enzyme A